MSRLYKTPIVLAAALAAALAARGARAQTASSCTQTWSQLQSAINTDIGVGIANGIQPGLVASLLVQMNDCYRSVNTSPVVQLIPDYCTLSDWLAGKDLTTCFNAAESAISAAGGGKLVLPATGSTPVYATPMIMNGVFVEGQGDQDSGSGGTTVKQPNGKNSATVFADGNAALFGTTPGNPVAQGTHDFGFRSLTIDGNMANNTTTPGNTCFQFWGYRETIDHLTIANCPGTAWHSEWSSWGNALEGNINRLLIDTCSYDGMDFGGPHDSSHYFVTVKDCGQAANNTYYGIHAYGGNSIANWYGPHPYQTSIATIAYKYSVFVDTNASIIMMNGSLEGGYTSALRLAGFNNTTISHTWVYGVVNGPLVSICSSNQYIDLVYSQNSVMANPIGIQFDNSGSCNPGSNYIKMSNAISLTGGVIDFTHSNGGNVVEIDGWLASGTVFTGSYLNEASVTMNLAGGMTGAVFRYVLGIPISALAACTAANNGTFATVNNGIASPTYHQTVSATGSTTQSVMCQGTTWVYL